MPALATKPQSRRVSLFEDFARGFQRVDRAAGIIYGAKIVGLESLNIGRTIGLDPREFGDAVDKPYGYAKRALEQALPKYDGAAVRIDHPETERDAKGARVVKKRSRSILSTAGEIKNPRVLEDGMYGDVHLILSHPDSTFLLDMAERMPSKMALSHNAYGLPELVNGKAVINEILAVYSVDIVGDKPGTTNGLFETLLPTPTKDKDKEMADTLTVDSVEALRADVLEIINDEELADADKLAQIRELIDESATAAGNATMESLALIESMDRVPDSTRVALVAAARGAAAKKALIGTWPKKGSERAALRPRSSAPLIETSDVGRQAQSADEFVRMLRVAPGTPKPGSLPAFLRS